MLNWRNLALTLGALLVLGAPTLAQDQQPTPAAPGQTPGQGRRARGNRQLSLTTIPTSVIDMITPLKPEQKDKIEGIRTKLQSDTTAASGDRAKIRELRQQAETDIKAVLTPEQSEALQHVIPALSMLNSSRTIPVAALPDVKLTKDQMDKIQDITKDEQAKMKDLQNLQPDERRTKMQEINGDFKTRAEALLTADQKQAIANYEQAHPRGRRGQQGAGTTA